MFGTAAAPCGQRGFFTRAIPKLVLGLALAASLPSFAQSTKTTPQNQGTTTAATAVEREGELEVLHWDNLDKTSITKRYLRTNDGKRYELKFKKHAPTHLTGTKIKVKGLQSDNVLALDSGTSTSSYQVLAMPAPTTVGAQNTAVLMVNFTNNTTQPYTASQVNSAVFGSTSNYFKENSSQQTWLSGNVYGWYTLPISQTCDGTSIANAAKSAAAAAGVDLSQYSRLVYLFPSNSSCMWSGLGTVGGQPSQAWINGAIDTSLVGHELGHNLGLWHSHSLECGASTVGGTCSSSEYGDFIDMMGSGKTGHFNAFQKERLGWLNYNVSPPIVTVSTSGTYTIEPYEASTNGTKALKVLKSTDTTTGYKTWYYIEFRQALGFDSFLSGNSQLTSGVLVHIGTDGDGDSSYLLDTSPNSSSYDWSDLTLTAGQSYTDSSSGLTITTLSAGSTGATVSVSLNGSPTPTPTCTHANPGIAMTPGQSATAAPGTAVTFTVSVTNTDSSACSSSSFNLSTTVPSGWSVIPANTSLTLAPGANGSASVVVTSPATASTGYYGINAKVVNGGATSYSASTSVTYSVAASSTTTTSQPPVAANDSASTKAGTPVKVSVLANDSSPSGKPLSIKAVGTPSRGSATINSDGTVTYTPNGKAKGSDSFTYTITDGVNSASATVAMQVSR